MGQALENLTGSQAALERAKLLVKEALDLLDDCGASADIGAHLDLALHRINCDLLAHN